MEALKVNADVLSCKGKCICVAFKASFFVATGLAITAM